MIALQRHRSIVRRVTESGAVRVADLARDLEVTEETIRRDLRVLDEQGALARTHGGAVAVEADPEDDRRDLPYDLRHATNPVQKDAIARAAAETIRPGQVIALDPSSTACRVARLIPDERLTVVTNSLVICSILSSHRAVEVICPGGTLDPEAMAFFGPQTQAALEKLSVERLFFSCRGLDLQRGLSEANERHAAVKLAMIRAAQRCTLLADRSKLGLASTVFYGPVEVAHNLIVDRGDDEAHRAAVAELLQRGVDVHEVDLVADARRQA